MKTMFFLAFIGLYFLTACTPAMIPTATPMPVATPTTLSTPTVSTLDATNTAFYAGIHATSTAQVATIIAIPVATSRPRTVTVSPTPGITMKYDSGVTPEQRKEIEDAVVLAKKYLGEVYNVIVYAYSDLNCVVRDLDTLDITCPSVRGNLGIASGNVVELNLETPTWKNSPSSTRIQVVVHEYAHIVQHYSASKQSDTPFTVAVGPIWLIEGGADYLAAWVVSSEHLIDYSAARSARIARAKGINAPLQMIENRSGARVAGTGSEYTLGFFGTELLAKNYGGEQNILKFFRRTATSPTWHDAFKETFGITIDDFYIKFEEYRRDNFPPNP